ncbi:hypothetical protein CLA01_41110 [Chryseobacterium lathyri]|uniref:Integrase catalytic domain-containing protein n=2 Tax=Chryseobacterium lathyri TaxID=395933 RepID=A0A511YFS8_9FLAO|nr:hypothetical protein CLA01_41110 [Chryseobacterium lathyri]
MKEGHLRSVVKKKFKKTANSSHRYPIVENHLNQDFQVKNNKEVWVSDITYIRTGKGWLYLTTVIDLFGRRYDEGPGHQYCCLENGTASPSFAGS